MRQETFVEQVGLSEEERQARLEKETPYLIYNIFGFVAQVFFSIRFAGEAVDLGDVKTWICIQIVLELLYLIRSIAIFALYKKSSDPKRIELYMHLVQIYGLWALTSGWSIYGAKLYNNHIENHSALLTVMWFMLFYNFFTVFYFIVVVPKVA